MASLKWLAVALATFESGYMGFDGARALVVGDYVTPSSGRYAGQLGPWTNVVAAVGIEPRSTLMKLIFVSYGLLWLAVIVAFALGARWAWTAMLIAALGSLWYLVPGTAISLLVTALLFVPAVKESFA